MRASPAQPVHTVPYRLRLEHEGLLSLRLQRAGPGLRFDPRQPPADGEVVVLTGAWPEQLEATAAAFRSGLRPQVVGPEPVLAWLAAAGAPRDCLRQAPATLGDISIEQWPATLPSTATPGETAHRLRSALMRPDRALRRLRRRAKLPTTPPQITQLSFPDGSRLVYLGLGLHRGTPADWIALHGQRLAGARWLLVGCAPGQDEALRSHLPTFAAQQVLVVDLLGELRQSLGLPGALLTPVVDQLCQAGLDAYVLGSRVSFRFE